MQRQSQSPQKKKRPQQDLKVPPTQPDHKRKPKKNKWNDE
jgi:hypothetical protein